MAISRSRAWSVTINYKEPAKAKEQQQADEEVFHALAKIKYWIFGREKGEEGTPHLQAYVAWADAKTLTAVKKFWPRAHLEVAKGNDQQNQIYCSKEGDYIESGEPRATQKQKGDMEKSRYQASWELAKHGRYEDIDADIRIRMYGTLKRIRSDYQVMPASLEEEDFHWYWGEARTGKSLTARQGDYYHKNINKWWDNYNGQDRVVIEEWSPGVCEGLQQMLKIWADKHPFQAEIKGGSVMLRPKTIIITSNFPMEECFLNPRILGPLKARFKEKEFLKDPDYK